MRHTKPASQDVLDATAPFIGGTVLTGMTCSALTAGVMALAVSDHHRLTVRGCS